MKNISRLVALAIVTTMVGVTGVQVVGVIGLQVVQAQNNRSLQGWTLNYCQSCNPSREIRTLVADAHRHGATLNPQGALADDVHLSKPGERTVSGTQDVRNKINELVREGQQPGNGQQQPDLPQEMGEVCVVVAAGWASENEHGQVYDGKDRLPSIPDGEEKYGECREHESLFEQPDCPYVNRVPEFSHNKGGDLNYRLFHDHDVTLGENVRTAKEQHGTGENVTYWIPNKQQAEDFANNGFRYYNINGQQVSPGPKQTDRRSITDPVTGDTYAVRQGCTFMEAVPDPDMPGSGGGGGQGGGGQEGGIMDKLLEFLTQLANSFGGNGGGRQERPEQEERESRSPLTDPETRRMIDTELDRISTLDLPTPALDKITEVVMDIIFRIWNKDLALREVFTP